jgi:hypothetical protein
MDRPCPYPFPAAHVVPRDFSAVDGFRVDLLRNAPLLKELRQINTAGTARGRIDIRNRVCRKYSLPELFDAADSGLGGVNITRSNGAPSAIRRARAPAVSFSRVTV